MRAQQSANPALHAARVPGIAAVQLPPDEPQGLLSPVEVRAEHQHRRVVGQDLPVGRVFQMLAQGGERLLLRGLHGAGLRSSFFCLHKIPPYGVFSQAYTTRR